MKYIHGYVTVSAQVAEQIARRRCEDRASDIYAWYGGMRTRQCVCGQHEGVVPIAPLLLDDEDDA